MNCATVPADAGGVLLRTAVAMAVASLVLACAVQVTLTLHRQWLIRAALEQAEQRAVLMASELAQALASAAVLPPSFTWRSGAAEEQTLALRPRGGPGARYRWLPQEMLVRYQQEGQRGSERLADGIMSIVWQRDPPYQGGWLYVTAQGDAVIGALPDSLQLNCSAGQHACWQASRYVAHPEGLNALTGEP